MDPPRKAPEFPPATWVNTYEEVSIGRSSGRVLLVEFWDYASTACLRTLPYLRAWEERYQDVGLDLISVHAPEYIFGRDPDQVKAAAGRMGIRWPIYVDSHLTSWADYGCRTRPTVFLIDGKGMLRYRHDGESGIIEVEQATQDLLHELKPDLELPPLLDPIRPEHAIGANLQAIAQNLGVLSVGNVARPQSDPTEFKIPDNRVEGKFYLEGSWASTTDGLQLAGPRGSITVPYRGAEVHSVLSPAPGEIAVSWRDPIILHLYQDQDILSHDLYGSDVFHSEGKSSVRVDGPRIYNLVHNTDVRPRELYVRVMTPGLTLYAFTFTSSVRDNALPSPTTKE